MHHLRYFIFGIIFFAFIGCKHAATQPEGAQFGFVSISEVIPDAILEIRYHSTYNFVGARVDGYEEPIALMTAVAADSLKAVSDELKAQGYRLKIFDAYRPQCAVDHFVRWSKDIADTLMKPYFYPDLDKSRLFPEGFICEKSSHTRGSTVDLTLFDMTTEREVDMGGTFDWFGMSSYPIYTDLTEDQLRLRHLLCDAMMRHGFLPFDTEWWHFTLKDEPYPDTYFNFPVALSSIRGAETQPQPAHQQPLCSQTDHYPQAEWDSARVILMHTPGIELFDGVIHPTAGLFEDYFNVDSAALEHRNYIQMLRNNGIIVYTVSDLLQQMAIDTLRALTAQVLHYDLSQATTADTAGVGEAYKKQTLHAMSREDMIRCLMMQPTVHLRDVKNNTYWEASYEHQSLMNLYFTRDQSITTPRGVILCHMNSTQRTPETRIIRACYSVLGIQPVLQISGKGRLEGGDYLPAETVSYIGCGMRTNRDAIQQIMDADAFGHDTVFVVCDHRFWQAQMHLDTYFNIIDRNLCTMVAKRLQAQPGEPDFVTVDIYARAQGEKAYRLIAQDTPFADVLRQRGMTIIPIEEEDAMHYANNFLTVAPRHILAVKGQSRAFQNELQKHGVNVEWVPLTQLTKGYGAAHCMTQVLQR